MTLTFNIVYAPDTVQQLSFLVSSLLKWSDCTFRLVANGCTPEEVQYLKALAQSHSSLTVLALPTKRLLAHGQALNYLQAMTRDAYFCFMDSDIYAQGEFLPVFVPLLQEYQGIFSCAPLKCKPSERVLPEQRRSINGWHNQTSSGLCLCSSYFAIYHNATLNGLIHTTGIGFESYRWSEIPSYYQEQLLHLGMQRHAYDTGKVLNLLLLARGEKLIYHETETLRHIGGVSRLHRDRLKKSFAHRAKIWGKRLLGRDAEQVWGKPLRKEIENYFCDLLQALHAERPLPLPPVLDDVEIATKLNQVTHELTVLYAEYRP